MNHATVAPPWSYTLHLPHDPRSPGVARAGLRAVLQAHGLSGLTATGEVLLSELATNAYLHSTGPYTVQVRGAGRGRVRLSVWDGNPEIPPPFFGRAVPDQTADSLSAERGRGLRIVAMCADRWGAWSTVDRPCGRAGKVLWVEYVVKDE
ncbi:ATP-binding protein [uncultured Streptomyces sp.]|uniref:ATP-binding protein n=1 Tax=uncultured Streptomyces sp. TaxID=174707 RepID=UPI0026018DC1|nr:ATP-binding protein [uncultured Streptomyces sp.]